MALKELDVTITEGRDSGKTFRLKEWPAIRTEDWIMRAVFGLGRAGVEIPPQALQLGAGPMAYVIGSKAIKLHSRLGVKLANELMECVTIVEKKVTRGLVEQDIEDFSTRLWLKWQVLKLTFGFFVPADPELDTGGERLPKQVCPGSTNAVVAAVVASGDATLHELQTIYGLEDLWTLFEIRAVAHHNENLAMKHASKRR